MEGGRLHSGEDIPGETFFKSLSHPVHQNVIVAEFRNTVMMAHHNAASSLLTTYVKC